MQIFFNYDPAVVGFDQSPFYRNEGEAQSKCTLSHRGCSVFIVEGDAGVKSRWTANLSTCSGLTAVAGAQVLFCEMLIIQKRARWSHQRAFARLPPQARVPKLAPSFRRAEGHLINYRELGVIELLKKQSEEWREGRDWRILLADDFSTHTSRNLFN